MEHFDEYKHAKKTLLKLVCQFYNYYLTKEEANELGFNDYDIDLYNNLNRFECIFHNYNPEGLYLWDVLEFEKQIYGFYEVIKLYDKINNEEVSENKDYYLEYLKLCLIDAYMIERYYKTKISCFLADKLNIKYDYNLYTMRDSIECCHHKFESAGEEAWDLLNIENPYISLSEINNIENDLKKKILKKEINLLHE